MSEIESGAMKKATELLTAAEMRAIETAAMDSGAVSGIELMERAGAAVVAAVEEGWPQLARGAFRVVVLCGPGNNGGDGFVIARLLRERGCEVELYLLGEAVGLPRDAQANCDRWREMGAVQPWPAKLDGQADLYVDAVFGAGLSRPVGERVVAPLAGVPPERIVAVDAPTGLCMDSGRVLGSAVSAAVTVTFHAPRPGHYLADGPAHCGRVICSSIGLRGEGPRRAVRVDAPLVPVLKSADGHKYSHGHALVLSGGSGRTGAARLTARGALRIGAGLVTLGVPGAAQLEVAAQSTGVMLTRVDGPEAFSKVLEDERINALCLGPGLGRDRARSLVPVALEAGTRRAVVLDADALSAFADAPDALFARLHPGCVLTPHGGEFARLFPDPAKQLAEEPARGPALSRLDVARAAAERAGCTVLLKGPDTVIARPDGMCAVNAARYARSVPWLATAGAGDVLAGFIAGLMARGADAFGAAATAAWLHVECALQFGPGLIAEDLPESLPAVLRQLDQAAGRIRAGSAAEESSTPLQ
ncbi:NAD(P)H-hydrate dehydratase [Lutimaribacter marinistellae]|uniref:Bifunctional NAD(P)H-hydrate repair enzyme n=1 Tax=Lutimaribacter marinistellae TaxID=1820329 RepID=A0ABV7TJS7_9RHOB